MGKLDKRTFAEGMTALCELYGQEMSEASISVYFRAVSGLEPAEFKERVNRWVQSSSRFPRPADLLGGGERQARLKALNAWSEAWEAAERVGAYRSVEFADPTSARVIRQMGGWPQFCRPTEDETWHRKRFLELYGLIDQSEDHANGRRTLCGIFGDDRGVIVGSTERPALTEGHQNG